MEIDDMKVAELSIWPDDWGDADLPTSNWSLAQKLAAFSHREACEFVFFVGDTDHLEGYVKAGFSDDFMAIFHRAHDRGFKYVCLYS